MRHIIIVAAVAAGLVVPATIAQAQKCPSDARRASAAVWPTGSIRTGQTVTGTHPCGRRIRCTGGTRGSKGSRSCNWL